MNELIIGEIASNLNITIDKVKVVLNLLSEGNTIPFIARYRKEATGNLDEEVIRKINEVYEYQVNLFNRKEDVIRLIDEKGLLTEELRESILKASVKEEAKKYLNEKVKSVEDAITGAKYIIAENVSDNADFRKEIRRITYRDGGVTSKDKKDANDEKKVYEMYYEFMEKVNRIKPHRTLALDRGEAEKVLNVSIDIDEAEILDYLYKKVIKKDNECGKLVKEAIDDSYKRLIKPSIEREIRGMLREDGEKAAIENFAKNLENLLLTPPIKEKVVMGYDPAFRTGCKLAVVDGTGKVLNISVIYPTEPHNKIEESKQIVLDLIDKYNVDIIAIGNGTASRESEKFIADTIKENKKKVEYIIVSEAGASVYSASPLAIKEFPDLTVEKRSAISIARRRFSRAS